METKKKTETIGELREYLEGKFKDISPIRFNGCHRVAR